MITKEDMEKALSAAFCAIDYDVWKSIFLYDDEDALDAKELAIASAMEAIEDPSNRG